MNAQKLANLVSAACLIGCLGSAGSIAQAQPHPGWHGFWGRDFHSFGPGDLALWRGGAWVHGWHAGRFAWWWNVDGGWYFYPAPIYPYPTYIPPAIVVQQAPPVPTGLPPAQSWYFCDDPKGYFPYVASCNGPWRGVPVAPPIPPQK